MDTFTKEDMVGYTDSQLAALNDEWEVYCEVHALSSRICPDVYERELETFKERARLR